VDGANWYPTDIEEIDSRATFALTWDGLKISNDRGITLHIGDNAKTGVNNRNLLDVSNAAGNSIFAIKEDGSLAWGPGSASVKVLYARTKLAKPVNIYDAYNDSSSSNWHKVKST
jgi:hypothetical protein